MLNRAYVVYVAYVLMYTLKMIKIVLNIVKKSGSSYSSICATYLSFLYPVNSKSSWNKAELQLNLSLILIIHRVYCSHIYPTLCTLCFRATRVWDNMKQLSCHNSHILEAQCMQATVDPPPAEHALCPCHPLHHFLPHWPGLHDIRCIRRMFWMFLMAAEIALNTQANPNATETPTTTTTTIADRKYLRELLSNFPHFPVQQQVNKLRGKFSVARSLKVKLKANVSKYFSGLRFVHFVLFISFWLGLLWLSTRGTVSSPISVSRNA